MPHAPSKGPPVRLSLADGSREVVLDHADFEALRAVGIPFPWFTRRPGSCSVQCRHPAPSAGLDNTLSVGRLIMQAPVGKAVRYHDGDQLNLRRWNLYLAPDRRAQGARAGAMAPAVRSGGGPVSALMEDSAARLVRVPLACGAEASVPGAAIVHLAGMGYSGAWVVGFDRQGRKHVRVCRADVPDFKPAFAWRSVRRDADGWRGPVTYADGNPLNLAPKNLIRGASPRRRLGRP